jgi:hypothetical protein
MQDTNLDQGCQCSKFYQDISEFYRQRHALCSSLYGEAVTEYCYLPSMFLEAPCRMVVECFCDQVSSKALVIKTHVKNTQLIASFYFMPENKIE